MIQERRDEGSGASGLKPAADVDLCVGFAAVVTCAGRVGGFFGPLENGKLRVAAMDDNPANRIIAFFAADFTAVTSPDHCRDLPSYLLTYSIGGTSTDAGVNKNSQPFTRASAGRAALQ